MRHRMGCLLFFASPFLNPFDIFLPAYRFSSNLYPPARGIASGRLRSRRSLHPSQRLLRHRFAITCIRRVPPSNVSEGGHAFLEATAPGRRPVPAGCADFGGNLREMPAGCAGFRGNLREMPAGCGERGGQKKFPGAAHAGPRNTKQTTINNPRPAERGTGMVSSWMEDTYYICH